MLSEENSTPIYPKAELSKLIDDLRSRAEELCEIYRFGSIFLWNQGHENQSTVMLVDVNRTEVGKIRICKIREISYPPKNLKRGQFVEYTNRRRLALDSADALVSFYSEFLHDPKKREMILNGQPTAAQLRFRSIYVPSADYRIIYGNTTMVTHIKHLGMKVGEIDVSTAQAFIKWYDVNVPLGDVTVQERIERTLSPEEIEAAHHKRWTARKKALYMKLRENLNESDIAEFFGVSPDELVAKFGK